MAFVSPWTAVPYPGTASKASVSFLWPTKLQAQVSSNEVVGELLAVMPVLLNKKQSTNI